MKVTIEAFYTMRNGGKLKKLCVTDQGGATSSMVADSTDMARLWGKVRRAQGGHSARDILPRPKQ